MMQTQLYAIKKQNEAHSTLYSWLTQIQSQYNQRPNWTNENIQKEKGVNICALVFNGIKYNTMHEQ